MTTSQDTHLRGRLLSLGVSVLIAIASGTPYLYGVYSPQLVKRVGLTTSDSATISLSITIGTSVGGLFGGFLIDHFGPQRSIMMGSICILFSYFGMHKVYEHRYANMWVICLLMILAGSGSITAFFSTIKAATANFPNHRGSAAALPVSAYGFAATIYSFIAATFFSHSAGDLLLFLAIFCGSVAFFGSFFNVDPFITQEDQLSLLTEQSFDPEQASDGGSIQRTESLSGSLAFWGIGERTPGATSESEASSLLSIGNSTITPQQPPPSAVSSIKPPTRENTINALSISNPNLSSQVLQLKTQTATQTQTGSSSAAASATTTPSPISTNSSKKSKAPWAVMKRRLTDKIFLTDYLIVSIISGIGQMYIYSVGFIVTAQYYYGKQPTTHIKRGGGGTPIDPHAEHLQAIQVSVISIASFSGRLIAGFVSDYLHKRFQIQRLWIVQFTIILMSVGQYLLIVNVSNHLLVAVTSAIVGGCYGLVFGTYPAIIADKFGTRTFSTTWGLICTGPLITLYVLNKYFGKIYDGNTDAKTGICYLGNGCYKQAFELSIILCFAVFFINLILIYYQRKKRR
ncbi:uncharacterized protein J8A68_000400 [[Candida] subhashii]|uniref:Nodulin-like domain-containing protein n=1 Tax=[Candida] subhashii TaxID=561895 RepID=A0A8J5US03_9ASCO|nr:uncharacterized protein J8A68_000400 [[Candida] subhashii]KAG7665971.1 hypothetical protein J8A68_000400 [[Candida] subhashii]